MSDSRSGCERTRPFWLACLVLGHAAIVTLIPSVLWLFIANDWSGADFIIDRRPAWAGALVFFVFAAVSLIVLWAIWSRRPDADRIYAIAMGINAAVYTVVAILTNAPGYPWWQDAVLTTAGWLAGWSCLALDHQTRGWLGADGA